MIGGRARGWVKTERKGVIDGKSERSNGGAEELKEKVRTIRRCLEEIMVMW